MAKKSSGKSKRSGAKKAKRKGARKHKGVAVKRRKGAGVRSLGVRAVSGTHGTGDDEDD